MDILSNLCDEGAVFQVHDGHTPGHAPHGGQRLSTQPLPRVQTGGVGGRGCHYHVQVSMVQFYRYLVYSDQLYC